jgi:hypothetical protein
MECIRCGGPVRRGIGQWIDNLHLLDDRTGPTVGHDHRQRIVMFRANVNEMNVESVDLGDKLRQCHEPRFHLPPVVVRPPLLRELLNCPQLHPLGPVAAMLRNWRRSWWRSKSAAALLEG